MIRLHTNDHEKIAAISASCFAICHSVAVDRAVGYRWDAVQRTDAGCGEDTRKESAGHASDTVELENFQAIVDAKPFVDVLEQADDDCGDESYGCSVPNSHEAGSGSDANKAGDSTFACTNDRKFLTPKDIMEHDPTDDTGRGWQGWCSKLRPWHG